MCNTWGGCIRDFKKAEIATTILVLSLVAMGIGSILGLRNINILKGSAQNSSKSITNQKNTFHSTDCPEGKIDINGSCNDACCSNNDECSNGQSCSISNGYCHSGTSCDPNSSGSQQPPANPGNSCPNGKVDINGACNEACCSNNNECSNGQSCTVSNGYCRSGHSCDANSSGTHPQTPPPSDTATFINVIVANDIPEEGNYPYKLRKLGVALYKDGQFVQDYLSAYGDINGYVATIRLDSPNSLYSIEPRVKAYSGQGGDDENHLVDSPDTLNHGVECKKQDGRDVSWDKFHCQFKGGNSGSVKYSILPKTQSQPTTNPGNSCPDGKKDINGACNNACCSNNNECSNGQKCSTSNGYCRSGTSCSESSSQPQPTSPPQSTCPDGKKDASGGCNEACCSVDSECPTGQSCSTLNGYCKSGKSCAINQNPKQPTGMPTQSTQPTTSTEQPAMIASTIHITNPNHITNDSDRITVTYNDVLNKNDNRIPPGYTYVHSDFTDGREITFGIDSNTTSNIPILVGHTYELQAYTQTRSGAIHSPVISETVTSNNTTFSPLTLNLSSVPAPTSQQNPPTEPTVPSSPTSTIAPIPTSAPPPQTPSDPATADQVYQQISNKIIFGANPYYNKINNFNERPQDASDLEWRQMTDVANGIKVTDGLQELVNKAALVDFFIDPYNFQITSTMREVESQGKLVMLTIGFDPNFNDVTKIDQNTSSMRELARRIKGLKHPVLRPFTEMNGSWYQYYPEGYSNDQIRTSFLNAARKFSEIMHQEAPNAIFLFNPNSGQKDIHLFWEPNIYDVTCFDSYVKGKDLYPMSNMLQDDLNRARDLGSSNMAGWCETGSVFYKSDLNPLGGIASELFTRAIDVAQQNKGRLLTAFLWPCMHYKDCSPWNLRFIEPNWAGYIVSQIQDIRNAISGGKLIDMQVLQQLRNPEDRQLVLLKVLLGGSYQPYTIRASFAPASADYNNDGYVNASDYIAFIRDIKEPAKVKNKNIRFAEAASIIITNLGRPTFSYSVSRSTNTLK